MLRLHALHQCAVAPLDLRPVCNNRLSGCGKLTGLVLGCIEAKCIEAKFVQLKISIAGEMKKYKGRVPGKVLLQIVARFGCIGTDFGMGCGLCAH